MAPKLSAGVSSKGAIAYQDNADPNQFHYFPSAPHLTLEDNLEAFSVQYWGIGESYYTYNPDTQQVLSKVGAILSGQVIFDLTGIQKDGLRSEISQVYGIGRPKLVPVRLVNVTVVPVFAGKVLGISTDGQAIFPTIAEVGSSVAYNVSNGSGQFAQLFANSVAAGGDVGVPNSNFALTIYGDIEFVGDPWKVEITAKLHKVWEYTRSQFSGNAQIGWFNIAGASFDKIMQEMQANEFITVKYIEGSYDSKNPGLQLFEQGKRIFEEINRQVAVGEGLFKLEPNPTPAEPPKGGGTLLPWSFGINGSYQSNFFQQDITKTVSLEYAGRALRQSTSSIVLAVTCGPGTTQYFSDFTNPDVPCITQDKVRRMQDRLKREMEAQNTVVKSASEDLNQKKITPKTYTDIMNFLQKTSLTETVEQEAAGAGAGLRGGQRRQSLYSFRRPSWEYEALLERIGAGAEETRRARAARA